MWSFCVAFYATSNFAIKSFFAIVMEKIDSSLERFEGEKMKTDRAMVSGGEPRERWSGRKERKQICKHTLSPATNCSVMF